MISDASSSNEAAHLQQRLKSLTSELDTLRRLHVNGSGGGLGLPHPNGPNASNGNTAQHVNNINNNHNGGGGRPQIPPHGILPNPPATTTDTGISGSTNDANQNSSSTGPVGSSLLRQHQILSSTSYHNKPLPPHPGSNNGTLNSHLTNGSGGSSSNNAINGGGSSGASSNTGFYVNQSFQKGKDKNNILLCYYERKQDFLYNYSYSQYILYMQYHVFLYIPPYMLMHFSCFNNLYGVNEALFT